MCIRAIVVNLFVTNVLCMDPILQDLLTPSKQLGEACGYGSCKGMREGWLNVHIVPHTHAEMGYTKNFDQHFTGREENNKTTNIKMKKILDTVIAELWADERRKFTLSDMAYFFHWWSKRDSTVHRMVYQLLRQGRLNFVGGGWSMFDEATTHYQAIIDTLSYTLRKLNSTFLECGQPLVAWQADVFGHSREVASILSQCGFDGLFINPISYDDELSRMERKALEFVWRGSDDLGPDTDIYTNKLFDGYWSPPGFCFDLDCDDPRIIVTDEFHFRNVDERVTEFIQTIYRQLPHYRTQNIMIVMGKRMGYHDSSVWFNSIDKLIDQVNVRSYKEDLKIHMLYSTPACYLKAVHDATPSLEVKQDDFFPFAYDKDSYATGFYTSRPTLKYLARVGNVYLQIIKQLQVTANMVGNDQVFEELQWNMGAIQDHTVITGELRQNVKDYYVQKMHRALQRATLVITKGFNKLREVHPKTRYFRCQFNISCCRSTKTPHFSITLYNPLAWPVTVPVRLPLIKRNVVVYNIFNETVKSVFIPIPQPVMKNPERRSLVDHELVFIAQIPPMGFTGYFVETTSKKYNRKNSKRFRRQTDVQDEQKYNAEDMVKVKSSGTKYETNNDQLNVIPLNKSLYKNQNVKASSSDIFKPNKNHKQNLFIPMNGKDKDTENSNLNVEANRSDIFKSNKNHKQDLLIVTTGEDNKSENSNRYVKASRLYPNRNHDQDHSIPPNVKDLRNERMIRIDAATILNINKEHIYQNKESPVNSTKMIKLLDDVDRRSIDIIKDNNQYLNHQNRKQPVSLSNIFKLLGEEPEKIKTIDRRELNPEGKPLIPPVSEATTPYEDLSNHTRKQPVRLSDIFKLLGEEPEKIETNDRRELNHESKPLIPPVSEATGSYEDYRRNDPYEYISQRYTSKPALYPTRTILKRMIKIPERTTKKLPETTKQNQIITESTTGKESKEYSLISNSTLTTHFKDSEKLEVRSDATDTISLITYVPYKNYRQFDPYEYIPSIHPSISPHSSTIYTTYEYIPQRYITKPTLYPTRIIPKITIKIPERTTKKLPERTKELISFKSERTTQNQIITKSTSAKEPKYTLNANPILTTHFKNSEKPEDRSDADRISLITDTSYEDYRRFDPYDYIPQRYTSKPTLVEEPEKHESKDRRELSHEGKPLIPPVCEATTSYEDYKRTDPNDYIPQRYTSKPTLYLTRTIPKRIIKTPERTKKLPKRTSQNQITTGRSSNALSDIFEQKKDSVIDELDPYDYIPQRYKSKATLGEEPEKHETRDRRLNHEGKPLIPPVSEATTPDEDYRQIDPYDYIPQRYKSKPKLGEEPKKHETKGRRLNHEGKPLIPPVSEATTPYEDYRRIDPYDYIPQRYKSKPTLGEEPEENETKDRRLNHEGEPLIPPVSDEDYRQIDPYEYIPQHTSKPSLYLTRTIPKRIIKTKTEMDLLKSTNRKSMNADLRATTKGTTKIIRTPERAEIPKRQMMETMDSDDFFITNQHITIRLHKEDKKVQSVELANGLNMSLDVQFYYYVSDDPKKCREPQKRAPGPYIFRPLTNKLFPIINAYKAEVYKSDIVEEIHYMYSEYTSLVLRLYVDSPVIEVEWLVGPIPINDEIGKEVFIKYWTDLENNGVFYTDANGRQTMKRIRNKRPTYKPLNLDPIAGNYYPVTSKISIEDLNKNIRFTVFTDRTQGGTSPYDGEIDLMLHRRLLTEDSGIHAYLNETTKNGKGIMVRGKHYLYITNANYKPNKFFEKKFAKEIELSPQIWISKPRLYKKDTRKYWLESNNDFSAIFTAKITGNIERKLPAGIHILTLEKIGNNTILLRLENYLDLAEVLKSGKKMVFLKYIFSNIRIRHVLETTLGGNMLLKDWVPLQWNLKQDFVKNFNSFYGSNGKPDFDKKELRPVENIDLDEGIVLSPQQIRTFIITYGFYTDFEVLEEPS